MRLPGIFITATVAACCSLSVCNGAEAATSETGYRDIKLLPGPNLATEESGELRPDAREVADLLKISAYVNLLRRSHASGANSAQLPRSEQNARILCIWRILTASQEVRRAVALINAEMSRSQTDLDSLRTKSAMTINLINSANFMQGGILGTIKQAGGLTAPPMHGAARQEIAMTSFGTGTGLGAINLFIPSLWRKRIPGGPNILSNFLNSESRPADADESYVWKFMNSPIPGTSTNLTRRQVLIKHWESLEGLNLKDTSRLRLLGAYTTGSEDLNESIRTLSQRMALLYDLRCHCEEFDGALYELQKQIAFN